MKRFERRPRPYKQITERDLAMVEATFEARYLTLQHYAVLFFGGKVSSSCKTRVRVLFDRGYLRKRRVYVSEPDVYFLGLQGRRYLAQAHPTYSRNEIDRIAGVSGGDRPAPNIHMAHDLTLSSLYVRARLEAHWLGYSLAWQNSRILELARLGLQPDAHLRVHNGDRHEAYLEFTSELDDLGDKVRAYDRYAVEARVLWVTTSLSKMDRIGAAVTGSCRPERFYLGLIEDCKRFLTESVWMVCDGEWRRVSFLTGGRSG